MAKRHDGMLAVGHVDCGSVSNPNRFISRTGWPGPEHRLPVHDEEGEEEQEGLGRPWSTIAASGCRHIRFDRVSLIRKGRNTA